MGGHPSGLVVNPEHLFLQIEGVLRARLAWQQLPALAGPVCEAARPRATLRGRGVFD